MDRSEEIPDAGSASMSPPFLYEIRVKGRLSSEQWTSWFDDLTVSTARGETTLRGQVPDHAALYGLLARLRDLAIPLVAVKVLDAEAQLKLRQQSRRYTMTINLLVGAVYLALLGGLSAITVFVAPIIHTALAMALLFGLLGGLAHAFWLWTGQVPWRWVTYVAWPAAVVSLAIFIPVSGVLPTALGVAIMLFLAAGGLIYLVYYARPRIEGIRDSLLGGASGSAAEDGPAGSSNEAADSDKTPRG